MILSCLLILPSMVCQDATELLKNKRCGPGYKKLFDYSYSSSNVDLSSIQAAHICWNYMSNKRQIADAHPEQSCGAFSAPKL